MLAALSQQTHVRVVSLTRTQPEARAGLPVRMVKVSVTDAEAASRVLVATALSYRPSSVRLISQHKLTLTWPVAAEQVQPAQ